MIRRVVAAALALACVTLTAPACAADLVATAARYQHSNPTGMASAWCARFLRLILPQAGLAAPGANDTAGSFLALPRTSPHRGAIVVLTWHHRRADHVGIVESIGRDGLHIISGNWSHRVGRGVVSPSSVLAFVEPSPVSIAAAIPWPIRHARRHRHHRHHHRRHRA